MPLPLLPTLTLGEGRDMRALSAEQLLLKQHTTPYDAHAIWMHAQQLRLRTTGQLRPRQSDPDSAVKSSPE
jgi:hypothetical protein